MVLWTIEEKDRLRQLWTAGHSATEIGVKLKRPRNSIIGKLDRLGLLGEERYKRRVAKITLAGPQLERK